MRVEDFSQHSSIEGPQQVAWVLFRKSPDDELSKHEMLGMWLFDFIRQMGFKEGQAAFIVVQVLPWAADEIDADKAAVIQLIDQRYLAFVSEVKMGFHLWDFVNMERAQREPERPLVSVAISLTRLYNWRVKPMLEAEEEEE